MKILSAILLSASGLSPLMLGGCDVFVDHTRREEPVVVEERRVEEPPRRDVIVVPEERRPESEIRIDAH